MRYKLLHNLRWLPNDCAIDIKLLTSGNIILSNEKNEIIFMHVFEYIKRSESFLAYVIHQMNNHTLSPPTYLPLSLIPFLILYSSIYAY